MSLNNTIQTSTAAANEAANVAANVVANTNNVLHSASTATQAKEINPFSLIDLFLQADIIVQITMVMLLIASVISWGIIFEKYALFKFLKHRLKTFELDFWNGDDLKELLYRTKTKHVMRNILSVTLSEFELLKNKKHSNNIQNQESSLDLAKERIYNVMQIESLKTFAALERKLSFLATIGSSAPFIGLFGTVWGIMNSFQSIALAKNTTLAVVAPGIAEALLATAFGLVTAIPAVIYYNKFSSEIVKIALKVECFQLELSNILFRELDK